MKNSYKNRTILIVMILLLLIPNTLVGAVDVIIEDSTPDLEAPILTSISVSSNEASPDSSVKISAKIEDELSGVESVRVQYKSQKYTSKYVYLSYNPLHDNYEGSFSVDKYDNPGEWKIDSVYLADKKANTKYIYDQTDVTASNKFDFSLSTINVSGVEERPIEETVSPVIESVEFDKNELDGPGSIKISAKIIEEGSGINYVQAVAKSRTGRSFYAYLYLNALSGFYEGTISIDKYDEVGTYKLDSISAYDNARNYTVESFNQSDVDLCNNECIFSVNNTTPDLVAPVLRNLGISLTKVGNNSADVKLTAEITDQLSGVSNYYVYLNYQKPSGKSIIVYLNQTMEKEKFEGSIAIDKYDELGQWKLTNISIRDNKNNYRNITNSPGNNSLDTWDFSPYYFTVIKGKITVPPSVPSSLTLSEYNLVMNPSETHQLYVKKNMTDDSSFDATKGTKGTTYRSSDTSKVTVDGDGKVTVKPDALPGKVHITVSNENLYADCEVLIPGAEKNDFLFVSPTTFEISSGQSRKLNVVFESTDGTISEVTKSSEIQYVSENPDLLNVTSEGEISVPGNVTSKGNVTVNIEYKGLKNSVKVNILGAPTVRNLLVSPQNVLLKYSESTQLNVRALMSDGSTKDITDIVSYTSLDSSKISVDKSGYLSVKSDALSGEVKVKILYEGIETFVTITIDGVPVVEKIEFGSSEISLIQGQNQKIKLFEKYSDESIVDITSTDLGTAYTVSDSSRVLINNAGEIHIQENAVPGTVTVTAKKGGLQATLKIYIIKDVSNDVLALQVNPKIFTIETGQELSLEVLATMGDGSTRDVTASYKGTTYTSSAPGRASVDIDGHVRVAPDAAAGTVTVTVKNGSYTKSVVLTLVKDPATEMKGLVVSPGTSTLKTGEELSLEVLVTMGDGSTRDVTAGDEGTTYTSSAPGRASVDTGGHVRVAPDAAAGTVTVTVKNGSYTKSVVLTLVKDPATEMKGLVVSPGTSTLKTGEELSLEVLATMGDGSTRDITAGYEGTTYTSSAPARASVDVDGRVRVAPDAAAGTVTVMVKNGIYTKSVVLTLVKDPATEVKGLVVSPGTSTLKTGEELSLEVQATMGDGSTRDVTAGYEGTTYTSSAPARASVDVDGRVRVAPDAAAGTVTVTVKNGIYTKSVVLTLVKDPAAEVKGLVVSPGTSTLKTGEELSLEVQATMGDGSTRDVTAGYEGTTYTSSAPARASVDADGHVRVAPDAAAGTVTVTVKNRSYKATFLLKIIK